MAGVVRVADGVRFAVIAPAGFRILAALDWVAQTLGHDITITSGTDGAHSGPDDPHHLGCAYDGRTHDLSNTAAKHRLLTYTMGFLGDEKFFGWIEAAGTANEHIHVQLRHGATYP